MTEKTLHDLLLDRLKDIYYAEKQILRTLPKMARSSRSEQLRDAFLDHREHKQDQIERLERIFEVLGKPPRGKICDTIQAILFEAEECIEEYKDSVALDAGIMCSAKTIENYVITRYGVLKNWATEIRLTNAIPLIEATLQEAIQNGETLSLLTPKLRYF